MISRASRLAGPLGGKFRRAALAFVKSWQASDVEAAGSEPRPSGAFSFDSEEPPAEWLRYVAERSQAPDGSRARGGGVSSVKVGREPGSSERHSADRQAAPAAKLAASVVRLTRLLEPLRMFVSNLVPTASEEGHQPVATPGRERIHQVPQLANLPARKSAQWPVQASPIRASSPTSRRAMEHPGLGAPPKAAPARSMAASAMGHTAMDSGAKTPVSSRQKPSKASNPEPQGARMAAPVSGSPPEETKGVRLRWRDTAEPWPKAELRPHLSPAKPPANAPGQASVSRVSSSELASRAPLSQRSRSPQPRAQETGRPSVSPRLTQLTAERNGGEHTASAVRPNHGQSARSGLGTLPQDLAPRSWPSPPVRQTPAPTQPPAVAVAARRDFSAEAARLRREPRVIDRSLSYFPELPPRAALHGNLVSAVSDVSAADESHWPTLPAPHVHSDRSGDDGLSRIQELLREQNET